MHKRPFDIRKLLQLLTVFLGILLEAIGIIVLYRDNSFQGLRVYILVHLMASFIVAMGFSTFGMENRDKRPNLFILIICVTIPILGPFGVYLPVILHKTLLRKKGLVDEIEKAMKTEMTPVYSLPSPNLTQFIVEEMELQPMVDIFHGQDSELKRGAIDLAKVMRDPSAINTLKKALNDPNLEIKIFAAQTLSTLEKDFFKNIEWARDQIHQAPSDAQGYKRLAEIYVRYCESGLIDKALEEYYLGLALMGFKKCLSLMGDRDADLLTKIGRVYMKLENYLDALTYLKAAINQDRTNLEAYLAKAEVDYCLRKFGDTVKDFKIIKDMNPTDSKVIALTEWWLGRDIESS
ncbi:MAG TPA: hypothetical protein EYP21_02605 [Syntrophaceae bacterium]|nr:hypothetical protein [Syntrophaceae bacterium]